MKKLFKILLLIILLIILINFISSIYLFVKYPIGYRNHISRYAKEFDVDPYLVAAIINVESRYDSDARSIKEAKGLMQIGPNTGQWASEVLGLEDYSEERLFEPELNIKIGSWYISRLLMEFDNNIENVILAYNAGSGNVKKWLDNKEYSLDGKNINSIPFKETEDYIVRVKDSYSVYKKVYNQKILNKYFEDSFFVKLLHGVKELLKIK